MKRVDWNGIEWTLDELHWDISLFVNEESGLKQNILIKKMRDDFDISLFVNEESGLKQIKIEHWNDWEKNFSLRKWREWIETQNKANHRNIKKNFSLRKWREWIETILCNQYHSRDIHFSLRKWREWIETDCLHWKRYDCKSNFSLRKWREWIETVFDTSPIWDSCIFLSS